MLPPSSSFRKVACLAACSLGLAALPLRAADAPATSHDWPVYNGNTNGILGGAWGYNGFVSNPIGRMVSVGLRIRM